MSKMRFSNDPTCLAPFFPGSPFEAQKRVGGSHLETYWEGVCGEWHPKIIQVLYSHNCSFLGELIVTSFHVNPAQNFEAKKCNIVDQQEIIASIETSNTKTSTV